MKSDSADEGDLKSLLSGLQQEDQIIPYATLAVFGLDERKLDQVAQFFSLRLCRLKSGFYFQTIQPREGEHKLQTVTLLAVSICLFQNFPKTRMALNVRHELMKENRDLVQEIASELEVLPEGCLRVSPACQLFLKQAGFSIDVDSVAKLMSSEEVLALKEHFVLSMEQLLKGA